MNKILSVISLALLFVQPFYAQIGFQRHLTNSVSIENYVIIKNIIHADIDGDGDEDVLAELDHENRIVWFENTDGLGTFSRIQNIIVNEGSFIKVQAIDIDGDNDLDILFRSAEDFDFVWLENTNDNDWSNRHVISTASNGLSTVIARDLDGDTDLDLITRVSTLNKIEIYENVDGAGTFSLQSNSAFDSESVNAMDTSDIDADGDLDIVAVYRNSNRVVWYENQGALNNFSSLNSISAAISSPFGISIADIDGDNDDDLVIASQGDEKIVWLEKTNASGDFGTPQSIIENTGLSPLFQASDMDNDGTIDLLYSPGFNTISWSRNLGNGNFDGEQLVSSSLRRPTDIESADFNGDGRLDVLGVSDLEGRVAWFNLNEPFFNNSYPVYSDVIGTSAAHGSDLDNDGDTDLVSFEIYNGRLFWAENLNGTGQEVTQSTIANIDGISSVYTADISGNGFNDIIYTSKYDNSVLYRVNSGGNLFNSIVVVDDNLEGASNVMAADFDADGDIDVVAVGYYSETIYWYENNGNGSFQNRTLLTDSFSGGVSVFIEDLNNDTLPDIIVASPIEESIVWFENLGAGNGFDALAVVTNEVPEITSIYVDDLDGDGLNDVLFGSLDTVSVGWLKNINDTGTFSAINEIGTKTFVRSVAVADIDGDLDSEIISTSLRFDAINWYDNTDGFGTFSGQIALGSGREKTAVFPVDMDGDLDIDFVTGSINTDQITWFENQGLLRNSIFGTLSLDLDNNGCDSGDAPMINAMVRSTNGDTSFTTFTDENGYYELDVSLGNFTTEVLYDFSDLYDFQPLMHQSTFTNYNNTYEADFCIVPNQIVNDLIVNIFPLTDAAPGFESRYLITYKNVGTTILNGDIQFNFDGEKLNYVFASQDPNIVSEDNLSFEFSNLVPFQQRRIEVDLILEIPPTNEIGNVLTFEAIINPVTDDITPEDNTAVIEQIIVGSFDPNDIRVLEGEEVLIENADEYLHYIIRFQNTGTSQAVNVRVTNPLDTKLDWTTMQMLQMSHSGDIDIIDGEEVVFNFDDINLPDINTNEPASHGYITYRIKPIDTIEIDDSVLNDANIFFDFNAPIVTNTVRTTFIEEILSNDDTSTQKIILYPSPATSHIAVQYEGVISQFEIYNNLGQLILKNNDKSGIKNIDIKKLSQGIYLIKLIDQNQMVTVFRFIKIQAE